MVRCPLLAVTSRCVTCLPWLTGAVPCRILRFVPVVFMFGFFAMLCCALMKSYRAGRWIVVSMCLCNMLLYSISGFETRGGGLDYVVSRYVIF